MSSDKATGSTRLNIERQVDKMECREPAQSPAPCNTTHQSPNPSGLPGKDNPTPVPFPSPSSEPFPAPWDSRGALPGVQERGLVTPTGARFDEVHLTPPMSLSRSAKSRVSVGSMCRICHEGEVTGTLMRPCRCSGTMGSVHRVCLERWLNLATTETCELCGYRFNLRYTSRPFWEFLVKCDNMEARRALKVDLVCLLVLTPLAALSVYLCSVGALEYGKDKGISFAVFTGSPSRIHREGHRGDQVDHEHQKSGWEAMVLVVVAVILVVIYTCWASFTLRYHVKVWRQWRVVHQDVALDCNSASQPANVILSSCIPATQDPASPPPPPPPPTNEHASHTLNSLLVSPS